jgi:hypothetical protein
MSMLSHSFVEDEANGEWKPDESQPMNYAVLRMNRAPILVTLVVGITPIGFVVAAWLIG